MNPAITYIKQILYDTLGENHLIQLARYCGGDRAWYVRVGLNLVGHYPVAGSILCPLDMDTRPGLNTLDCCAVLPCGYKARVEPVATI